MKLEGTSKDLVEVVAEILTSRVVGWFEPIELFEILRLLAIN